MRCYIEPDRWTAGRLLPSREEAHYLGRVLRVEPGASLEVFDGAGRTAPATVVEIGPDGPVLEAGPARTVPPPRPGVTLIQALPKAQKLDWVIEKGTELGLRLLQPVVSHRTISRPEPKKAAHKLERWQAVALSATRQCGAAWLPEIAPVTDLDRWLERGARPDLLLFGELAEGAPPIRDVLRAHADAPPECIGIVIGPEGDIDDEERAALRAAGAQPVGLGPLVLRTETAALFALGAVRYEFL